MKLRFVICAIFFYIVGILTIQPSNAQTLGSIQAIAWSHDGSKLAAGYSDGVVRIWDTNSTDLVATLEGHTDAITSIGWSPVDNRIVTGSFDGTVRVWNSTNGAELTTLFEIPDAITWVGWNPIGTQILSFSFSGGRFNIWNSTSYELIKSGRSGGPTRMIWNSDHSKIGVATVVGRTEVWDAMTFGVTATISEPDIEDGWNSIYAIAWNLTESRIAYGTLNGWIRIWDWSSNQIVLNLKGTNSQTSGWDFSTIRALIFNSNGNRLTSLSTDGMLKVWDTNTGASLKEMQISTTPILAAAFSPDGSKLAYGGESGIPQFASAPIYSPSTSSIVPLPINRVRLSWTDNSTDETNFRIERSDNGTSGWSEIATIAANQTTYTETRTACIQQSYYRIRAYRSSDQQYSEYTPVVSVTTDGCGPDRLALFNTVHTHNRRFTDFPGTPYNDYWLNAPVASGLWVMGDWDGNGVDTPAVFNQDANTFAFTNGTGATSTWVSMTLTVDGVPVAGRFDGNRANDCLGVVDDIPWGSDTAFALWFACDYTNLSPNIAELGYQWLGIPLANSAGYGSYGVHQFVMGDFDTDGVDTVAVRRGTTIAYGNTAPTTQLAALDKAQYFGNPYNGQYGGLYGIFVAGDWNYDGVDTFGYFYEDGNFYWRNHLDWNQPISGSALISQPYGVYVLATTWRN